jgi:uncharacterized zinc-type alcohol dehydrogenase-like protein
MNVTLPPLRSTQVQIKMTHSGLCHTDQHMKDNDWGIGDYPMVPGHEGVGIVEIVGSEVDSSEFAVGGLVGVGWIRDACGVCPQCRRGSENLCEEGYQGTYLGENAGPRVWGNQDASQLGCFSRTMRVESKFAFPIPKAIPPQLCPLLCAGGTVYEPLETHVKAGMKVGIGSIGGLGTLALKLAKLKGAHVVAISRSSAKKTIALAAGADEFLAMDDPSEVARSACSLDVVLDTSPKGSDPDAYLNLLKFGGTLCRVGLPPADDAAFTTSWIPLIFTGRTIAGSIVTGTANMKKLLALAAKNKEFLVDLPNWQAVERPFSEVNEASADLMAGKSKGYRTVLKW